MAPTVSLLARNQGYFAGYGAGRHLYAAAAAAFGVGLVLYGVRRLHIARLLLLGLVLLAPAWVVLALAGAVLGRDVAAMLTVLALAAAVALLSRRSFDAVLPALGIGGAVLIAIVGGGAAFEAMAAGSPSHPEAAQAAPSPDPESDSSLPSVYHLVFDEFQTDVFELLLDPGREERLAGFVLYPEASAPWGRTETSLASMFAPAAYDYTEPLRDYVDAAFTAPGSPLVVLRNRGLRLSAHLHRHELLGGFRFDELRLHDEVAAEAGVARDDAGLLVSLWLHAHLPERVAARLVPGHHHEQLAGDVLLPDDAPAISAASFEELMRDEVSLAAGGRYLFAHLIHPHFPYVLDERCGYRPGRLTNPLAQAECAVRQMEAFISQLQDLDRFNDALILIHSDHGARFEVTRDGELVNHAPGGNYTDDYATARARPLVLVKPPGVSAEDSPRLRVSTRRITLDDLLPTVLDALGIDVSWGEDRASAIAQTFPERPVRHYHFYDKHSEQIIDGDLHRWEIVDGRARYERRIPVP